MGTSGYGPFDSEEEPFRRVAPRGLLVKHAPWTEEEVASLNAYQASGHFHEYTGENGKALIATKNGWVAVEGGPVVQTSAHEWITNGKWRLIEVPALEAAERMRLVAQPLPAGRANTSEGKRSVIEGLLAAWEASPRQRLGQLIVNAMRDDAGRSANMQQLFGIEDLHLLRRLRVEASIGIGTPSPYDVEEEIE